FGISFHQDIIQSRISLAKHLLITTKMNISSIAGRCGYDDDKHFMHQFKQSAGISPNMYRKNESNE
ncbi:MAG: helix-turn-helix domain-containing protein, partial [Porcipelethomonas sp.]